MTRRAFQRKFRGGLSSGLSGGASMCKGVAYPTSIKWGLVFLLLVVSTYTALIWTNVIQFADSTTKNNVGISMAVLAAVLLVAVLYVFTNSYIPQGSSVLTITGPIETVGRKQAIRENYNVVANNGNAVTFANPDFHDLLTND